MGTKEWDGRRWVWDGWGGLGLSIHQTGCSLEDRRASQGCHDTAGLKAKILFFSVSKVTIEECNTQWKMYGILVYFFICGNPVLPPRIQRRTACCSSSLSFYTLACWFGCWSVGRVAGCPIRQINWWRRIGGRGKGKPSRDHLILRCMFARSKDLSHLAFPRKWKEHKCNK